VVAEFAENNFISLKVDVDQQSGSELFSEYNGRVMPTLVFVDNSGKEVDRIIGYLPPEEYQHRVSDIQLGVNTITDCIARYDKGERSAELVYILASKFQDRNDPDKAAVFFKELINNYPDADATMRGTATYRLAYYEFENGNMDPLNAFIDEFSDSPYAMQAIFSMARFYGGQDNIIGELGIFNRGLSLFPNNSTMLNSYAWRMAELEVNLDDALEKAEKAVELTQDTPEIQANIIDTQAEVLWKLGRIDEAIMTIEKAIIIDPTNDYFMEQKFKFVNTRKEKRRHVPA